MRALTVISILFFFAAYSCQSHDLMLGQTTFGDVLLYKVNEYKYGFPFFVRTSLIKFPVPGTENYASITAIYIKDNDRDGSGGYAEVYRGGIGKQSVRIELTSQRGRGFNFTVTIYGRY